MGVTFAFIDETYNSRIEPHLSSCTALVIPAERYDALRMSFYRAIDKEVQPEPRRIATPPELHWRDFLPKATDNRRLEVLEGLVDLLPEAGASIYRVSYFVTDVMRMTFEQDPNLHALAFLGLQSELGPLTQGSMLFPVIDAGFEASFQKTVRSYSGSHRLTELLRSVGIDPGIDHMNWVNQGEILYADSEFSAPLQLVDVLGGVRNLVDARRVDPDHHFSPFKDQIFALARRLDAFMACDSIIAMDLDGQVQGPVEFSHKWST